MIKKTLDIGGMHCASCSTLIEQGLQKMPGIDTVAASMATNSVTISYDEDVVSFDAIVTQIQDLGYTLADASDTHEIDEYWSLFVYSALCTLPVGLMMFVDVYDLGIPSMVIDTVFVLLTTINVAVLGRRFHLGMWKKARQGQTNMDTLISLGTGVALIYSIYGYLQKVLYDVPVDIGHFMMGASFIVTFLLLGKYFEIKTKGHASQALQKLLQLQEKEVSVLKDGQEMRLSIDDVQLGDVVVVRAGDKMPVDGEIVEGESDIDEAMLTGESVPLHKKSGDAVYMGTIVVNGQLHITVTTPINQTKLAQIIEVVHDAQADKPPIQKMIDVVSSYFVGAILVIAAITFVWWYVSTGDISQSLLTMISVIVIACPCAMGLATPVAIMVASGRGASSGVLITSGQTLEKSQHVDVVVFDKTGTLTAGKPQLTDVVTCGYGDEHAMHSVASVLSAGSHHPLSQAIARGLSSDGSVQINDFEEIAGHGLYARDAATNEVLLLGNVRLMDKYNVVIDQETLQHMQQMQEEGKTVNIISRGSRVIGLIGLLDTPKDDAVETIQQLKSLGIEVVMISGDTTRTVAAVANTLGIDRYYAEILPAGKLEIVQSLQESGLFVAFVGDGINDAPALTQADLAISMGEGSDIAIEAADIVLVHSNPLKVVESIQLARKTYRVIKQNLFWAFAYNVILVPVAALGLLMPMYASLAMSLSSVSVILNSLRLK